MTVAELIRELRRITIVHPEAAEAQIWARCFDGPDIRINHVGWDTKHHPHRLKLMEN